MHSNRPVMFTLTPRQEVTLLAITRRDTAPQNLVRRARVVLLAARGANNAELAHTCGLRHQTVRVWRRRFADAQPRLLAAEAAQDSDPDFTYLIEQTLKDEPRPGAPAKFTAVHLVQFIKVALEDPIDSDRPVTHWTPKELADEVVKRQIVPSISQRHMGRILHLAGG